MLRLLVVALVALPTLPAPAPAQGLDPAQDSAVAAVFADLDAPDSPGASVAVIRDGRVVYSRGFGSAQLEYGIPVTPETVFHVASVSKQITAMAVLLLAAEGAIDLDRDIRTWMPDVPDMGGVITPRRLLQHTSGVRDQWELLAMAGWRLDDVITKEHVRRMLLNQRELNFEPGAEYLYSNMGYSLAADLVERVSGTSFADFAAERIFRPLGMERTHVHDDHEMIVEDRAYSYAATEAGYRKSVLSYANHGATSLFTTAEDLARWLDNFRTAEVGGTAAIGEMTTRAVLATGDTVGYGLGVSLGRYRGAETVSHGGADAGFRSFVSWFPEHDVGIAVASNFASGDPVGRAQRVADVVLGEALEPRDDAPAEAPDDAPAAAFEVDPEALPMYEGLYRLDEGAAEFEVRDGALWIVSPQTVALTPVADHVFTPGVPGVRFEFTVEGGKARTLAIVQSGERMDGVRVEVASPPAPDAYVGTYYAPELETLYRIEESDEGLRVSHLRFGHVPLRWSGEADVFLASAFFLSRVRFTRDDSGAIDGFRLTGGRVRDLRFVRVDGGLPGN